MSAETQVGDSWHSGTREIRLVAGREIATRLRSKAYRLTTLVLVVLVVGFAVTISVVGSSDSAKRVGFVGAADALAPRVDSIAGSLGQRLTTVRVKDERAGRRSLSGGKLDALVLAAPGPQLRVVVQEELDDSVRTTLTGVARQAVLDQQIGRLGGNPAAVTSQVDQATVRVSAVNPPPSYDPQRLAVGSIAGILIYIALIITGQSVAIGVVEEKSSRVVELLLATIRPWQLMAGKVLGIGLVGLLQVAAVAVTGVLAGKISGSLDLSVPTSIGLVSWLVVWFVLGFTLYSLVFAGLGALVSRQEDVSGAVMPATLLLVAGYVVGISVLPADPGNPIVAAMSVLPMFSPTLMPMRLAIGGVPLWQTVAALTLALVAVPVLVALAGRLYRNGVVRTGARLSLRQGLRGSAASG